ncbi:MAG: hypothetical protein KDK02_03590 [Rhodobacteraceae bacterium]|nr:hypothetical protein [Paracoccaceae bacterium]
MLDSVIRGRIARAVSLALICLAVPATANAARGICSDPLTRAIPERASRAPSGSAVMHDLADTSGEARDKAVMRQVLSGNVPSFLRHLVPVTIPGTLAGGRSVLITICVTPGYLAVGDDDDFVRVPLGLAAAAQIADRFGFFLPTTRMVDAIYSQAQLRVAPSPMKPTSQMSSTAYLMRHNATLEDQRHRSGHSPSELIAGEKKDIVLTERLRSKPGRVAIYGWHRTNGRPIQPLSTVHGASYADYSHGVRLVSQTAYVDGKPRPLAEIMRDRDLSGIVNSEGPIGDAERLMASLY